MINILIVNNIKLMQQEVNASIKLHFTLFAKKGGGHFQYSIRKISQIM